MKKEVEFAESMLKKDRSTMFESPGFLSSGSTLLNLACTGTIEGAWGIGSFSLIVGDSRAGKTWLAMSAFAEACADKRFDGYELIYDGPERGAKMDIERFFGKKAYMRIKSPAYAKDGSPLDSETLEEFYFRLDDLLEAGTPFVYVIDSIDCLSSYAERSKFDAMKGDYKKGKPTKGIMTDGKAKVNSGSIRQIVSRLQKTGSILLVLSQTRDSLEMFTSKSRSGGKALRFYNDVEVWLSIVEQLTKQVRGKKRKYGIISRMKIEKSRTTGRPIEVDVPIIHSVGIDDIGCCLDYLIEEGEWKVKGKKIVVDEEFLPGFDGSASMLVKTIEEEGKEKELREIVGDVWQEIERSLRVKRKKRYE